ncbi:hypothetical protein AAC387_Pa09g0304 [Persea americana]
MACWIWEEKQRNVGYVSDEQKKRYGLFGYGKRSREMGYVSDEQKKRYGLLDMGREAEKWVMFLISRRKDTAFGKFVFGFDCTGPYYTSFLIESVADLRCSLQSSGFDLIVRIGHRKA